MYPLPSDDTKFRLKESKNDHYLKKTRVAKGILFHTRSSNDPAGIQLGI
jgi:hypothetical protein